MAVTLPETLKAGVNPMLALIAKEVVTSDSLASLIPIEPVDGTGIKIRREGAQPSTAFIPDSGVTSEESTASDDVPEVQFRRIVGNMDIDKLSMEVGGSHSGNLSLQTGAKAKATWQLIKGKMINGAHSTGHSFGTGAAASFNAVDAIDYGPYLDSSRKGPGSLKYTHSGTLWAFRAPGDIAYGDAVAIAADGSATLRSHNRSLYITITVDVSDAVANAETPIYFTSSNDEFDGLYEQLDPARIVDPDNAAGDNFSIAYLDRLISLVKVKTNRAFILDSTLIEQFYAAYRALGGTDPRTLQLPGYGAGEVPLYRGIPLLDNDNMPVETVGANADCSSIVLAALSFEEGFFLGAASGGGQAQALTPDADPRTRPVLGFRIEDLSALEGKDAMRRRVKWYGTPILRSTLAAARRRGVRHVPA